MRLTSLFRAPAARRVRRPGPFRLRVEPLEDRTVPAGFSTFLGGSNSDAGGHPVVDAAGNTYVIGHTDSSDFPITFGTVHGQDDIYLVKLGPDGGLLWATMFGGSEGDFTDPDPVVDGAGDLYLTGTTYSTDFPTTAGAYQEAPTGTGGFSYVMKVDGATGAILYSTYLSASGGIYTAGIAVDAAGNAYLTGDTGSTDFPTTSRAYQPTFGGGTSSWTDAFVLKLDPTGSSLVYATYLGGGEDDWGGDIAVDAAGNAYVSGTTWDSFPTTAGAYDTTANGPLEAFVAKLDPTGSSLIYSTYFGGGGSDYGDSIAVDAAGNAFVAGWTSSTDLPTTGGAFDPTHNGPSGGGDAYVAKLDPTGSSLVYATYVGGNKTEGAYDLAVDGAGNVYLTGNTASTNFPTTPDAASTTLAGPSDAFVAKLDPTGGTLVYATYLGGGNDEYPLGIATDRGGNAYVSGNTLSADFPTSEGAYQGTYGGGFRDAFLTKFAIGGSTPSPAVTIDQAAGQADPTNATAITFDVAFDVPVTGFDGSDIDLTAGTVGGTLLAAVSGSGSAYTVTVTGMAGTGTVVASIPAGAAEDSFGSTSLASTSSDNTVTFDGLAPSVTINQAAAQSDPAVAAPITFTVHFNEVVTTFDGSDVSFAGSTVGGTLIAGVTGSGGDYTVTVSGMIGQGNLVASIPAGAATDAAGNGNAASTSTDNTVAFDNEAPAVIIDQADGQADPTSVATIRFAVHFSEPVSGFDPADVSLAGSTAGGTLSIDVSGSLDIYTVTVTGMTTRGLIVATIPAGAATDLAGNASLASTSTDNAVDFRHAGSFSISSGTVLTAEGSVVRLTVGRTGGSEGVVSVDFAALAGTAHANDYNLPATTTLTWGEGDSADQAIAITIINDDANEGRENFTVNLLNAVGGATLGTTSAAASIAPSDGKVIQGLPPKGQKPSAIFTDSDGDLVTVVLGGKAGTATVYLTDPNDTGKGPIEWIDLAGTDPAKSTLTIAVKKPKGGTGDVRTTLAEVSGTGLMGLAAKTTDLIGTGIHPAGWLGSLTVGNVGGGADIILTGTPPALLKKPAVRINALVVGDGTDVTVAGAPLASLTVTAMGNGTVSAPSAGTITTKGKAKTKAIAAIAGHFNADVDINGVGADPARPALKTLKVAGGVTDAVIRVTGNLGGVSVAGRVAGTTIDVTGNVGAVSVGSFWNSRLDAGYSGANNGGGTFDAASTVGPFQVTAKAAGFQNSYVIATTIKQVTLGSITEANGGTKFGFIAEKSLAGLTIVAPTQKFKFDPKRPSPQPQGIPGWDFEVIDLDGPAHD